MSDQNVTFFGDLSDDYDRRVEETQKALDYWVEQSGYGTGHMVAASTVIAFVKVSQSLVDTLKFGNGIASGTLKGVALDGLRLLNVTGVGGAAFSRVSRLLVVRQGGGFLCSWISTVNAVRLSGQRYFVSLLDLAKEAGVDLRAINMLQGTPLAAFYKMQDALRRMGIPIIALKSSKAIGEITRMLEQNPRSVLVFAFNFTRQGMSGSHQMIATFSKSAGLVIRDTTGAIFRSLEAMQKVYPQAELLRDYSFVIKNAAIMNAADVAQTAGALAGVILELMPVEFKNSGDKRAQPRSVYYQNRHKAWEY